MNNYVKRVEDHFEADGQRLKFVGFNMRGLAHYGDIKILPHSKQEHQIQFLKAAKDAGSAVIRIFLAHSSIRNDAELINRLQTVLDKAALEQHQQRVIVSLTDHYETSRFQHWSFFNDNDTPKDEYICQPRIGTYKSLSPEFYAGLYRGPFLTYVKDIVKAFKDHPAIFCWELTNEGNNHGRKDIEYNPNDIHRLHTDFINYCTNMANEIRAIDFNHMVTAGVISTRTIEFEDQNEREQLYRNLDFITLHDYPREAGKLGPDIELARKLKLPFIIEEVGVPHADRGSFENLMNYWFGNGASGFLGWGFQPVMNGDGDNPGIHVNDGNYPQIIQLWHEWSQKKDFNPIPPLAK